MIGRAICLHLGDRRLWRCSSFVVPHLKQKAYCCDNTDHDADHESARKSCG